MNKDDQYAWQRHGDQVTKETTVSEDMAEQLDTLEGFLQELVGNDIDPKIVALFANWHLREIDNYLKNNKNLIEALPWFLAWALDDQNPALKLWATAFALGMQITEGVSQSQKASELKVTRAAISKRVGELRKQYGFESRNMKSADARDTYSKEKKNNHHRYQKQLKNAKNDYQNDSN